MRIREFRARVEHESAEHTMARLLFSLTVACACMQLSTAQVATCDTYCTHAVGSLCNLFGRSKTNCMSWCGQYESVGALGNIDATSDNSDTIGCRDYHWMLANSSGNSAVHCPHAGPTGGNICGGYCDVYCCVQNNATCPSNYATLSACQTACAAISTAVTTVEPAATTGSMDNIQCRLNHLALASYPGATTATMHCPHADQDGSGVCTNSATCSAYCDAAIISDKCNHFGGSKPNCLSWCAQYETAGALSLFTDTSGDTIGCRHYHLSVANAGDADTMATHCPHGGPTGGNVCGSYCDVYCGVQNNETCSSNYNSSSACQTACAAIATTGEPDARAGDTVQCRLNHLSLASFSGAISAAMHCPHADQDGSGVCSGSGAPETSPTTTSGAVAPATAWTLVFTVTSVTAVLARAKSL